MISVKFCALSGECQKLCLSDRHDGVHDRGRGRGLEILSAAVGVKRVDWLSEPGDYRPIRPSTLEGRGLAGVCNTEELRLRKFDQSFDVALQLWGGPYPSETAYRSPERSTTSSRHEYPRSDLDSGRGSTASFGRRVSSRALVDRS